MHISRAERDIEYRDDVAAVEASAVAVEGNAEEFEDVVGFQNPALSDAVDFENATKAGRDAETPVAVAELNND